MLIQTLKRCSSDLMSRFEYQSLELQEAWTRASPVRKPTRPHSLPGKLVVSLTSYPKRFPALQPTLKRLLSQTIRPDLLILWLTKADRARLPREVIELERSGLTLGETEDFGSYKKFVPAAHAFPDAFMVTVDDDVAYPRTLLSELVSAYRPHDKAVVARRARRIVRAENAIDDKQDWWSSSESLAPYWDWPLVQGGGQLSSHLVATGGGGVLYPPGAITEAALDTESIRRICPTTDDLWLTWMVRRNGFRTRMVSGDTKTQDWNETQAVSLWKGVNREQNDAAIAALYSEFGSPFSSEAL